MSILIVIVIAFLLLWLFVARPQRRRQNEQLQMQDTLRVGDESVTAGGLYGAIEEIDEDEVAVEIADGVTVRIARRAIAGVIPDEDEGEIEAGDGLAEAPEEANRS